MEDDKENLKPEKFELKKLLESNVLNQKCPPTDANIILALGSLYQKIESMQTLLDNRENRISQLEANYKDLHECFRKCIKSQKKELDDLEEKWMKINERNKRSIDGKLDDIDTLFYSETSTIHKRFDDIEQNFLNIVRENEDMFSLEIKSMKDRISQNITKLPLRKALTGEDNRKVRKSPSRQVKQKVTEARNKQDEHTANVSTIKREPLFDNDFICVNSDAESTIQFDINNNNERENDTETCSQTAVKESRLSKANNASNSANPCDVRQSSDRRQESLATEVPSGNRFFDTENVTDIHMAEDGMYTSDADSDMMVEITTIDSDNDELQNLSSNSEDGAMKFESKYELLNSDCGVFRWFIEDFHDIQFNGFDIYSQQFTIDYLVHFELKISWFDELKESIVLELVTSDGSTNEKHSAIVTCEGNGCFNSQVILSNEKSSEPFLFIDRTDVDISERCTSKTLCDFVENNTLFINCYFSFKDMIKGVHFL